MDTTKAHVPKLKSRMIFLCFLFLIFFYFYLFIFFNQVCCEKQTSTTKIARVASM